MNLCIKCLNGFQERRNLQFMQELRYLFALMLGSKRKYVDPSKALDILKEAFSSNPGSAGVDSQQVRIYYVYTFFS